MKSGFWGGWGQCVFKTLSSPSSFSDSRQWGVQAQNVINGYPQHQFTGESERVINLSITLHNDFCDLTGMTRKLLAQANTPQAEPLVVGHEVLGSFKIKTLGQGYDETTPEGVLIATTYKLTLTEVRE